MTNTPDLPRSPDSDSRTTTDGEAPAAAAPPSAARAVPVVPAVPEARDDRAIGSGPDPVLDAGTYDAILEPRGENRLPLGDGVWHQISPKYVTVQLISTGAFLALVVAAGLFAWLVWNLLWVLIPAGVVAIVTIWTLVILPRQARAYGYQLREDDLVFRRGILWQRMVAVPYGRMQLVDITHGPLDRGFGIAQLKLVTAAATTGVTIPGLGQQSAERLRDTLIAVAETRRTGL